MFYLAIAVDVVFFVVMGNLWWRLRRAQKMRAERMVTIKPDISALSNAGIIPDAETLNKSDECEHDWRVDPDGWKPTLDDQLNQGFSAIFGTTPTTRREGLRYACANCPKIEYRYRSWSLAKGWAPADVVDRPGAEPEKG